jgi:hypothetical protein
MRRVHLVVVLTASALALAAETAREPPPQAASPEAAFVDVARVLQSPRCVNCHPNGDAPLQGDHGAVHAMGITRDIERVGMTCQTCHRDSAVSTDPHMPPAVKGWSLPRKETPLVFQGRTPATLCAQLKDPAHNGNKDLAHLLSHVTGDGLVLYGWNPGGKRTLPPLPHDVFVARFTQWVDAGAPCPK